MYFKVGWDQDFDNLMMHLYSKYGRQLFTIDGIGDQMDLNKFAKNFFVREKSMADVSVDSNANVGNKTVIDWNFELSKPLKRYNSYFLLWKEMKKLFGTEVAAEAVEKQLTGEIYINDFTDVGLPYCANYSLYDLYLEGLPFSSRMTITPARNLASFIRQTEQFIVYAANSTLGATGIADFLLIASLFVRDILDSRRDGHIEVFDTDAYVKELFTSFIYTINWEFRGNQCVTEDTEVLTPGGFKTYDQLSVGDDIYTWKDGSLNVNKVKRVNVYDYSGVMHSYSNRSLNQVITPNHRILFKAGNSNWQLKESENVFNKYKTPISIPVAFDSGFKEEDYPITDEMLSLVTYFLAEGLPEWVFSLSRRQINIVLDIWSGGKLECATDEIADGVQHLAMLGGYGSRKVVGKNSIYVILFKGKSKSITKREEVEYEGKVWCPTTDDGVVVFRKNGAIFISGNSPFCNISVYDKTFLNKLCPDYKDRETGEGADVDIVYSLQKIFMKVMNEELRRTALTFPVTTACFATDENKSIVDREFKALIAEENMEHGFINMYMGKTSTLSSCCRLRSDTDNPYFNSFGAGSTKIGSIGVVTINLPRLAYDSQNKEEAYIEAVELGKLACRINHAKRSILKKRIELGAMPLYTKGFMSLEKQYSTIGFNGLYEAVKDLGYDIREEKGLSCAKELLGALNFAADWGSTTYKAPHNVEQVPAESSAVKLVQKDRYMGYPVEEHFYSNQFVPLTASANMLTRLSLQGELDEKCSGGSICHVNVGERIKDKETLMALMDFASKKGVVYWAVNYAIKRCEDGHVFIDEEHCPVCGKPVDNVTTRVVGFFTNVKHWNKTRREEDFPHRQFYVAESI